MSVTSYKIAGTGASADRDGKPAWSNPGRITADDASYTNSSTKNTYSSWLRATNFGFTSADILPS